MTAFAVRLECPECGMNMVVVKGFGLDKEHKTSECLRCGYMAEPIRQLPAAA
jgi:uncharacterized Zn finger protein